MIYSKTSEYAIRSLKFLAQQGSGARVSIEKVNAGTGVPRAYLAKIFRCLMRAGILSSRRGPEGGFGFRRDPSSVRLFDVVQSVDDLSRSPLSTCVMGLSECGEASPCVLHEIWAQARGRMNECLKHRTILEEAGSTRGRYANHRRPNTLSKRMRGVFK